MPEQPIVCIIDDDDAVRDSIRMLLEAHRYPVRTYPSGSLFLRGGPPEGSGCLLNDVNMPDINGLKLLDQLRKRGIMIPAIVMTDGLTTRIPASLDGNGSGLVEKPFRAGELIGCIKAALGRYRA